MISCARYKSHLYNVFPWNNNNDDDDVGAGDIVKWCDRYTQTLWSQKILTCGSPWSINALPRPKAANSRHSKSVSPMICHGRKLDAINLEPRQGIQRLHATHSLDSISRRNLEKFSFVYIVGVNHRFSCQGEMVPFKYFHHGRLTLVNPPSHLHTIDQFLYHSREGALGYTATDSEADYATRFLLYHSVIWNAFHM